MSRNKYIGVAVIAIVVIGVAGGWLWHMQQVKHANAVAAKTLGANVGAPLSQTQLQTGQGTGGLSVSQDNQAAGLGQLGSGNDTNGSGSASSGSSSTKSPFDPTTYAQYDKYKDAESALFADVVKGTGDELTAGKTAVVVYKGWLTNGTLFDQSRTGEDGKLQAFSFQLGSHNVIPGWEQTMAGMKVGGVRLLIIPPVSGYGATGQNGIPPNSVLIFQVQLAAVQ
jgi:FKBP-type peptidyl-prolyl cis-trans isomerase FkpA